jgi:hypothetical protein
MVWRLHEPADSGMPGGEAVVIDGSRHIAIALPATGERLDDQFSMFAPTRDLGVGSESSRWTAPFWQPI